MLLVACSGVTKSTYVELAGFHVVYAVTHDEGEPLRASASFQLEEEGGTDLRLTGGDSVSCDGEPLLPVTRTGAELLRTYESTVSADTSSHTFVFTRPGEPLATHRVPSPTPLALFLMPAGVGTPSPEIVVRWGDPLTDARIDLTATSAEPLCPPLELAQASVDTGFFLVERARLDPPPAKEGAAPLASCGYRLTVVRTVASPIGEPFHSGELRSVSRAQIVISP